MASQAPDGAETDVSSRGVSETRTIKVSTPTGHIFACFLSAGQHTWAGAPKFCSPRSDKLQNKVPQVPLGRDSASTGGQESRRTLPNSSESFRTECTSANRNVSDEMAQTSNSWMSMRLLPQQRPILFNHKSQRLVREITRIFLNHVRAHPVPRQGSEGPTKEGDELLVKSLCVTSTRRTVRGDHTYKLA